MIPTDNIIDPNLTEKAETGKESSQKYPSDIPIRKKKPLRVLVVDDNDANAQTLSWAVQMFGHDVSIARDGSEALCQARAFLPQVVLLDIGMPGINGYEVCQSMKRIPELQETIYIAQTGWSEKQHRDFSKQVGFDIHLVKPIDLDHLERILAAIE